MITEMRFVLRGLRRAPGYAAAVVVLLAIGLASTVAVVSVVDRVLLRPLPFPHPDTLFSLFESTAAGEYRLGSYPTVRDWQAQSRVFQGIAYVPGNQLTMTSPEGRELLTAAYPTGDFFPILGVNPLMGRVLSPEDDREGARVVVLSRTAWLRRFGGDPHIVGKVLPLGEGGATVVGVMPRSFRLPEWADLWMPFSTMPHGDRVVIEKRGNHADSRVIGRLRAGVTAKEAEQEMDVIAARLAELYPSDQKDWPKVALMPLDQYLAMMTAGSQYEDRGPRLVLFLVGALLVLLVAIANVATLALARGFARSQELAVLTAIGASRARLAVRLLFETGLLAVVGSGLGIWLGMAAVRAIQRANPDLLPRLFEVELDGRMTLVALGIALVATMGAGLWPALQAARPPLEALTAEGNRTGDSPRRRRVHRTLVLVQVTMATMLLVGAGVMLRSFRRVVEQPAGFEPDGLASVVIQPPPDKYATPEATLELYHRIERAVAAVPGVRSVAFTGGRLNSTVRFPDREPNATRADEASLRTIAPNYFEVMGIPILRGEGFTEQDLAGPNGKLMVNEAFVRQYWPGSNPIGRSLSIAKAARWLPDLGQPIAGTVIGVARDMREGETEPSPEVYLPYTWNLWRWGILQIRAARNVESIREPVRRALLAAEPDLPMAASSGWLGFHPYSEQMVEGRAARRLTTVAIASLSAVTLLLAALGLYAVVAYSVTRRRREIGIRLALGSERRRIVGLVLREGFVVTASGLGLGLLGAWFAVSLLRSLLFGVAARDPVTFLFVPLVLGLVAVLAVALPARRAASVPPAEVLRS